MDPMQENNLWSFRFGRVRFTHCLHIDYSLELRIQESFIKMKLASYIIMTRSLLTCLVYAASVSSARPRTRGVSRQTEAADRQVSSPWRRPCSGEVMADFRFPDQTSSTPRLRRHWSRRALAWSRHLSAIVGNRLRDTDVLTTNALAAYIDNYFKNDTFHIASLSDMPRLDALNLQAEIDENMSVIEQFQKIFTYLQRAAVFVDRIRADNEAKSPVRTEDDLRVHTALHLLEHGGTLDGIRVESGLYPSLCRLMMALVEIGQIPNVQVNSDIIPVSLRHMRDMAAMHNRDFYLLKNVQYLLSDIQRIMRKMQLSSSVFQ